MMGKELVFIGDSLIEYFDWQRRFPAHRVWNFGRSGETVQELLLRIPAVVRKVGAPDWLLVMSGINNVAMADYGFLPAYGEVLERLRSGLPGTTLAVNSLLPVRLGWVAPGTLSRLNGMLQDVAASLGVAFLDLHDRFLDGQGQADRRYLLEDGVHLSDAGYSHWADLCSPGGRWPLIAGPAQLDFLPCLE